jgi:hypothetical protein
VSARPCPDCDGEGGVHDDEDIVLRCAFCDGTGRSPAPDPAEASNDFKVWRSEEGEPWEVALRKRGSVADGDPVEQRKAAERMVDDMYGGADD